MDSVRLCAANLGYTVIDENIASKAVNDAYAELEVIARVCAKDKTKLFVFSDTDDIARIQQWRVRERITGVSNGLRVGQAYLLHQQVRQSQNVEGTGAFTLEAAISRVCHLL